METKSPLPTYYIDIFSEMAKRVGIEYKDIDFREKDWYTKHEWSSKEQDDFKKWLINYWKKNKKARYEMTGSLMVILKTLGKAADVFVLNFGWKLKTPTKRGGYLEDLLK